MNILILGGAGFVGNNLVRKCLAENPSNKVTVFDSLDPRLKSNLEHLEPVMSKINFIKGDIRNSEDLQKVIEGQDIIFNCAAQTSHPLSLLDPVFDTEINCIGNLIFLETVKKHNPKAKIIYVSSSTVIGKAKSEVVDEKHGELPLDIYSANKGVAEKYYYIYHKVYDLDVVIVRFANLYGPYGKGSSEFGFINFFISQAIQNKEITIYGSGEQKRNVMYVGDAVDLLYRTATARDLVGEVYFAVHKEHYSIKDIANQIVSVMQSGSVKTVEWPEVRKRIEIDDVIIDGRKLYDKLHWTPKYTLKEGLEETKKIIK